MWEEGEDRVVVELERVVVGNKLEIPIIIGQHETLELGTDRVDDLPGEVNEFWIHVDADAIAYVPDDSVFFAPARVTKLGQRDRTHAQHERALADRRAQLGSVGGE